MSERDDHVLLERLVAEALRAPDPGAAYRRLADDTRLPAAWRAHLADVDADHVRISGLLVARLRFERLLHGSARAGRSFQDDPADFARTFRRYHAEVAPRAAMPAGEARLFERWLDEDARRP